MEIPPPAAGGALWGACLVSRGLAAPSRQDFEPQRGSQGHTKRQRWQDHERVLAGEGSSSERTWGHRGNVGEEKQKLPMAK